MYKLDQYSDAGQGTGTRATSPVETGTRRITALAYCADGRTNKSTDGRMDGRTLGRGGG